MVKGLFPSPTLPPPDRGILLGFSQHPTDPSRFCSPVYWRFEQRPRHSIVVGGSGMGKSMLLRVMMRQDIEQGNGFALFDPHGELVEAILFECSHGGAHSPFVKERVRADPNAHTGAALSAGQRAADQDALPCAIWPDIIASPWSPLSAPTERLGPLRRCAPIARRSTPSSSPAPDFGMGSPSYGR
jgi:Domain of unknown function DUF87.